MEKPPETETFWKVLNKDYLKRLSGRPPQDQNLWTSWAKAIVNAKDPQQAFLNVAKHMLSTGSAGERLVVVETIAHYFGANVETLVGYLKAEGALWRGLRKADE